MKRLFTQIILSVFFIQLVMSGFAPVGVYAASGPLRNVIECGDMETESVPAGWVISSSAKGSTLEIVEDTADPENKVLRFDGTGNTGTISYISYNEVLTNGTEYYYTYKIRLAEDDANTIKLYSYMGLTPATSERKLLSKEWLTRSGTLKGDGTTKMNFKIIKSTTFSDNAPNVIYELDDIVICDMSGAQVLDLTSELNGAGLNWKSGVVSKDDMLYARPDTSASFTLTPPLNQEIDSVSVNGEVITPVDDVYNIGIPDDLTLDINVEVAADDGVPSLLTLTPKSGIQNADPMNMVIKANFDRTMDIDSLKSYIEVTPDVSFDVEDNGDYSYNIVFDELEEATEYTVVFTENISSEMGMPMEEPYTYTFATASPCTNIIENSDMSNTLSLDMYNDNNSGNTSYTTVDGNSVLRWKATWTNAPLTQYLNDDSRSEKYDFVGGHKYYVKARIKPETDVKMVWSILYVTETDTTATHPLTWVTLEAGKWTVLHNVFTVPENVSLDKTHGVRLVAATYPHVIYVDDVELIDCTITSAGQPTLISSYPENGANEVEIGTGEIEVNLDFDKSLLPTTVNTTNITAKEATIKDIKLSEDKKSCVLTLSQLKVNKTVEINYKNISSMAGEKADEGSISFDTKTISTDTPLTEKITPAHGAKVGLSSLKNMEIVYDLPLDGPIDKTSFTTVPENLIDAVNWSYDNPNVISLVLNKDCLTSGNTYSVTLLSSIKSQASTPINQETITFSTITTEEIVQDFKAALTDSSQAGVQNVLDFISEFYIDLAQNDSICSNMIQKDSAIAEKFATQIIAKGIAADADADDVVEMIRSNAVLVIVNDSQNDELISDAVNSILAANNMTALTETYGKLTEDTRAELCGDIKSLTKDFNTAPDFVDYLEQKIIVTAIQGANGWKAISDVLNNNIESLSDSTKELIEKINASDDKAEIYLALQGKDASDEDDIYNTLKSAYNSSKEDTGNKPGSSGGSGGSGGGGGKVSIASGNKAEMPSVVAAKTSVFKDIDSVAWAKEAIEHLYELKVVSGKSVDTFCPNDFVTREEFVKMIVIAANIPMTEKTYNYSDVNANEWYYPYIMAATEAKLVQGIDSNNFGIGQNISRQDIATICSRLMVAVDESEMTEDEITISDYDEVSEYAKTAVSRLVSLDIIKGDNNGRFAPRKNATRAETAVLLQRFIAYKNSEGR